MSSICEKCKLPDDYCECYTRHQIDEDAIIKILSQHSHESYVGASAYISIADNKFISIAKAIHNLIYKGE